MIKLRYMCLFFLFTIVNISAQTHFYAKLTGSQETPSVISQAIGVAAFSLTNEGLEYIVTVNGLTVLGAHIHYGEAGVPGTVVRNIDFTGNSAFGVWTKADTQPFADSLLQALLKGNLYINVHTSANPGGEIRGQIIPSTGTPFRAELTGTQETPPNSSTAIGTGSFLLTDVGLVYKISVNIPDIIGAHFHLGKIGEPGGVVKNLDFVNNTAAGIWMKDAAVQPLADSLIMHLLLNDLYVNIHTSANTAGEIRGQVLLTGGIGFTASIENTQEFPPTPSTAAGVGHIILTPHGVVYKLSLNGITPSAAQFYSGLPNTAGTMVKTINLDGLNAEGVWTTADNTEPLTKENILDLLKGNIFINILSANYPDGEIRGVVKIDSGTTFHATFTGKQEKPETASSALGTASLTLNGQGLSYNIVVNGIAPIAAHFHMGVIGNPGGVVRNIVFDNNHAAGLWSPSDASEPLLDSLIDALLLGEIYINFHSTTFPAGEIRGQVLLDGGVNFTALLTPNQETPPTVNSIASGTAYFIWTDQGLIHNMTLADINPLASHFHYGDAGIPGGVVSNIILSGNHDSGIWKKSDALHPFVDSLQLALFKGSLYVNAHTALSPAGEIRGQIYTSGGWGFIGALNGAQSTPPVVTTASGTSFGILNNAGLTNFMAVDGLTIIGAHFHNAQRGTPGGVVRDLDFDFTGNSAFTLWSPHDQQPFTNDMRIELVSGNIYENIHTNDYPDGEIRGQLSPTVMSAILSVKQVASNLPLSFSLSQNYPNPFNPSTNIRFSVPNSGLVNITIYNLLGQKVAVILNEVKTAGTYDVSYNASNLPSGIYFYNMKAESFNRTMKMILLK
ncbi:MAG: CHRD domain-containing protein [Bacteroidota bacterium]|nr:CHRD domain-containing protein [Bacteroidota bacterium]